MENIDSFPIYVFHEGKNYQAYKLLSPHRIKENGQVGWVFHLWAPQAKSVSVVGDFNGWNRSSHPMEKVSVGIWRTFIPFLEDFDLYKYSVEGADGQIVEKADPFALHTETPPKNASRLFSMGRYSTLLSAILANNSGKRSTAILNMIIYPLFHKYLFYQQTRS